MAMNYYYAIVACLVDQRGIFDEGESQQNVVSRTAVVKGAGTTTHDIEYLS
jgi:hypothetical protein